MAHPYPGQDSAGLVINPYIAGKGYFVIPDVPDDNDDRDAGSVGVGVEALTDRTVWIGWRMVNGLEGGTYPGTIVWTGSHTFQGNNVFSGHNTFSGVVEFTNAVTGVTFATGITVSAGTSSFHNVDVENLNVGGDAVFAAGNVIQVASKTIYTGDEAYEAKRSSTPGTGNRTIELWKADLWLSPSQPAPATWTLTHPPTGEIIEATVMWFGSGSKLALQDPSFGLPLIELNAGSYLACKLIFDGTSWRVSASNK
ncbi:MAG: hypothetical protein U0441_14945 [Polyangiaceae bacterium]